MNNHERIDYLIRTLEGNNARAFAAKTGIRTDSLSRMRNGLTGATRAYNKILDAYPEVRREWLVDGEGAPFVSNEEKSEVILRLEALEKQVRTLTRTIGKLNRILAPRGAKNCEK